MAIFNSYVKLPEGMVLCYVIILSMRMIYQMITAEALPFAWPVWPFSKRSNEKPNAQNVLMACLWGQAEAPVFSHRDNA